MINAFLGSIKNYLKAIQLLSEFKLWSYVLLPGLMSLLLGLGILSTAWGLSDNIGAYLIQWYPWEWGKSIVEGIASITGGLLMAIMGLLIYRNLIIVLVGPFMSPLSEKVENKLIGNPNKVSFSLGQMIKDMVRGIHIALRNIIREIFWTVILLLLGLIPVFAPFTTAGIFLVQSFYAGFGNFDFFLERHYGVKGSVAFVKRNRWAAIGNGAIFLLLIFTIVGVLIAPVLGTIAATIEGVKKEYADSPPAASKELV